MDNCTREREYLLVSKREIDSAHSTLHDVLRGITAALKKATACLEGADA